MQSPGSRAGHTAGVFSMYSVAVEGVGGGGAVPWKGEARGAAERLGSGLRWGPFWGTRRCPPSPPQSASEEHFLQNAFKCLLVSSPQGRRPELLSAFINDKRAQRTDSLPGHCPGNTAMEERPAGSVKRKSSQMSGPCKGPRKNPGQEPGNLPICLGSAICSLPVHGQVTPCALWNTPGTQVFPPIP